MQTNHETAQCSCFPRYICKYPGPINFCECQTLIIHHRAQARRTSRKSVCRRVLLRLLFFFLHIFLYLTKKKSIVRGHLWAAINRYHRISHENASQFLHTLLFCAGDPAGWHHKRMLGQREKIPCGERTNNEKKRRRRREKKSELRHTPRRHNHFETPLSNQLKPNQLPANTLMESPCGLNSHNKLASLANLSCKSPLFCTL